MSKASFRVRSFLKAIKRLNPVTKKAPVTVELLSSIYENFIDPKSVADLQLWASLTIGFFGLRISEIGDLGENDLVSQSTEEGVLLLFVYANSKQTKKGKGPYFHYCRAEISYSRLLHALIGCAFVAGMLSLIRRYSLKSALVWWEC